MTPAGPEEMCQEPETKVVTEDNIYPGEYQYVSFSVSVFNISNYFRSGSVKRFSSQQQNDRNHKPGFDTNNWNLGQSRLWSASETMETSWRSGPGPGGDRRRWGWVGSGEIFNVLK